MTPYYSHGGVELYVGSALTVLAELPSESVQCAITSPPFFQLRSYLPAGHDDKALEIGSEPAPAEYIARLVAVFAAVRRVLKPDGLLFLEMGDSYYGAGYSNNKNTGGATRAQGGKQRHTSYSGERSYGTSGRALGGYPDGDSSSSSLCDGCRVALPADTSRTHAQRAHESSAYGDDPSRDRIPSDDPSPDSGDLVLPPQNEQSYPAMPDPLPAGDLAGAPLHGAPASTTGGVSRSPQACHHCANCGACLSVLRSSSRDARACARNLVGPYEPHSTERGALWSPESPYSTADIGGIDDPSRFRSRGMADALHPYPHFTTVSRFRAKQLMLIPHRLAIALGDDGWLLRQTNVWHRTAPMPESVHDRTTTAHSYVFQFAKQERYHYDHKAISEPAITFGQSSERPPTTGAKKRAELGDLARTTPVGRSCGTDGSGTRNRRSVWTINPEPNAEAHFAVMPTALVKPLVLCSTRPGDVVLDPFVGSGTTCAVSKQLGRNAVGIDLSESYVEIAIRRLQQDVLPLFDAAVPRAYGTAGTDRPDSHVDSLHRLM